MAIIIVTQVTDFGFSLIQTKEIITVKKGPDDKINKVEATEEWTIEKTYPQKEIERKKPTIRSFTSNDLKNFFID